MPNANWPALLDAQQLTDVDPGAVAAAIERVRSYVGWHLAPAFTETIEVEGRGVWVIPTRRIITINTITDVTSGIVSLVTDFTVEGSIIKAKWSRIWRRLSVNLTHGYDSCPSDVIDFVRDLAKSGGPAAKTVSTEQIGQTQVSYNTYTEPPFDKLNDYALPRIA